MTFPPIARFSAYMIDWIWLSNRLAGVQTGFPYHRSDVGRRICEAFQSNGSPRKTPLCSPLIHRHLFSDMTFHQPIIDIDAAESNSSEGGIRKSLLGVSEEEN